MQKDYKMIKTRKTYMNLKQASNKIKGFFIMRKMHSDYVQLKRNTLIIQNILKPILYKKILNNKLNIQYIKEQTDALKNQQNSIEKLFNIENSFKNQDNSNNSPELLSKTIENAINKVKNTPSKQHIAIGANKSQETISPVKQITPFTPKNIEFFMLLLDLDCMVKFNW